MDRMRGKVVLVTGAGSGIGRATALLMAVEGAAVAAVDLDGGAARNTVRSIEAEGGQAIALEADVTTDASCAAAVNATLDRFGRLAALVNSAGVRPAAADRAPAPEEWQRVIDVNLTGTYLCSRAALPALSATGGAAIVNLASIYGLVGGSLAPSYAASKGAIVNLTRQMALQCAPAVRVNCVCPGHIETPMTAGLRADAAWRDSILRRYPLGRLGQPDEVALAILFLASDEAAFITGVALPVDGGYTAI
jgi:NAD(P)-dependent dehydrogenase (short-subunit alcohol dehydrogenase family)